jgi:hypothetical protein
LYVDPPTNSTNERNTKQQSNDVVCITAANAVDNQIDLTQTIDANAAPARKKWNAKALPIAIAELTDKDWSKFVFVNVLDKNEKSKINGKEFLIAQAVRLGGDGTALFELNQLTIDQIRRLCRNLGILSCGSQNKFDCLKTIALYFSYKNNLE